eukprot:2712455-Pyramimonas_sp.AAC.1
MAQDTTTIQVDGAMAATGKELPPGHTPLRCAGYWLTPSWTPSITDGPSHGTSKAGTWKAT